MSKNNRSLFKKMIKILLYAFVGVVIVLSTVTVAEYIFTSGEVKYKNYRPRVDEIVRTTIVTGNVIPRKEVEIKPQIAGIIDEIYFKPGSMVKKNQVIAKLRVIPEMIALNEAEARLKMVQLSYKNTELDFMRQTKLYDKNLLSLSEFEDERLRLNTAKAQLDEAENYLQLIKEGVFSSSGKETNTLIKATIDGTILEIPVKKGNSVIQTNAFNDGTTIAVIADMTDFIFQGSVLESEVNKLDIGMNLKLSVAAVEDKKYDAVLEYIAPKGFDNYGSIKFEIKANIILKEDESLRAGLSANAEIILDKKENVMIINEKLLKFENDKAYVEILEDPEYNLYEKQFVEIGLSNGIDIEITSGLEIYNLLKGEVAF